MHVISRPLCWDFFPAEALSKHSGLRQATQTRRCLTVSVSAEINGGTKLTDLQRRCSEGCSKNENFPGRSALFGTSSTQQHPSYFHLTTDNDHIMLYEDTHLLFRDLPRKKNINYPTRIPESQSRRSGSGRAWDRHV